MNVSVVLVMAGKSQRMKSKENKNLLFVGKKRIFEYPLSLFLKKGFEVVCVISKHDEPIVKELLPANVKVAYGGATRQESVRNGLELCTGDYVMIHDAARAFVSEELIDRIVNSIDMNQAVITFRNVKDTIKLKENGEVKTLPRYNLLAAATPQCAALAIMKEAHQKAFLEHFETTDDMALIEKYFPNMKINYVLSNDENFKITTPLDYELAKLIGEKR